MFLPNLGDDITIMIVRGSGGGLYKAMPSNDRRNLLTYEFEGSGGDYQLEVKFLHPEKWPREIILTIDPSF